MYKATANPDIKTLTIVTPFDASTDEYPSFPVPHSSFQSTLIAFNHPLPTVLPSYFDILRYFSRNEKGYRWR